jgi:hypothetical protein
MGHVIGLYHVYLMLMVSSLQNKKREMVQDKVCVRCVLYITIFVAWNLHVCMHMSYPT